MENHLEFYPSPGVLLTNKQTESMRKLSLDSKPQDISDQLSQRPGVLKPSSGLTTSQQTVPKPPGILLVDPVRSNSNSVGIRHNRREMEMKYNNFVYAGGNQYDISN